MLGEFREVPEDLDFRDSKADLQYRIFSIAMDGAATMDLSVSTSNEIAARLSAVGDGFSRRAVQALAAEGHLCPQPNV